MSEFDAAKESEFINKCVDIQRRTGMVLAYAGAVKIIYKMTGDAIMQKMLSGIEDKTKVLLATSEMRRSQEYFNIIEEVQSLGEELVIFPFN